MTDFPGFYYDPVLDRYFPAQSSKKPKLGGEGETAPLLYEPLSNNFFSLGSKIPLPHLMQLKTSFSHFHDHNISNLTCINSRGEPYFIGSTNSPSILSVLDPKDLSRIMSIFAPFIQSPITELKFSGSFGLISCHENLFLVKISKDASGIPLEVSLIKQEAAPRRYIKNPSLRNISGQVEGLGYAYSYDNFLVYSINAADPNHYSISPIKQNITATDFWRSQSVLSAHSHGYILFHHDLATAGKSKNGTSRNYLKYRLEGERDAAKWIKGSRDRCTFSTFSHHNYLGLFDIRLKGGRIGKELLLSDEHASSSQFIITSDSLLERFYYGIPGGSKLWIRDIRNLSYPILAASYGEEKLVNVHSFKDERVFIELQSD